MNKIHLNPVVCGEKRRRPEEASHPYDCLQTALGCSVLSAIIDYALKKQRIPLKAISCLPLTSRQIRWVKDRLNVTYLDTTIENAKAAFKEQFLIKSPGHVEDLTVSYQMRTVFNIANMTHVLFQVMLPVHFQAKKAVAFLSDGLYKYDSSLLHFTHSHSFEEILSYNGWWPNAAKYALAEEIYRLFSQYSKVYTWKNCNKIFQALLLCQQLNIQAIPLYSICLYADLENMEGRTEAAQAVVDIIKAKLKALSLNEWCSWPIGLPRHAMEILLQRVGPDDFDLIAFDTSGALGQQFGDKATQFIYLKSVPERDLLDSGFLLQLVLFRSQSPFGLAGIQRLGEILKTLKQPINIKDMPLQYLGELQDGPTCTVSVSFAVMQWIFLSCFENKEDGLEAFKAIHELIMMNVFNEAEKAQSLSRPTLDLLEAYTKWRCRARNWRHLNSSGPELLQSAFRVAGGQTIQKIYTLFKSHLPAQEKLEQAHLVLSQDKNVKFLAHDPEQHIWKAAYWKHQLDSIMVKLNEEGMIRLKKKVLVLQQD